jgi:hypothetical protein
VVTGEAAGGRHLQPLTRGRMIEDCSMFGPETLVDCFDERWMTDNR